MSGGMVPLRELAKKEKPEEFLKAIFHGLICDEFQFLQKDTFIKLYCISAPFVVSVPPGIAGKPALGKGSVKAKDSDPKLSLHLNFKCTHSLNGDRLNLRIEQFHISARTVKDQDLINDHGSSDLTAGVTVHINRNTDWGRQDEIEALAVKIAPATRADMLHVLNHHFPMNSINGLVREWRKKLHDKVAQNVGSLIPTGNISFDGSDKTFSE